jgi:NitT/TauT family transport system substrate-binding protein
MNASMRVTVAALVYFANSHLPAAAQQLVPFRVGITDAVNTVLPVWMAQEGGFYAANGLKVEIINMGGGTRGAKELQAGTIDLMRVGMSSVVQANTSGGDLRLIGSMSNVIRFVIATAPGVKSAADLKGGVIGVSSIGSESDSTVTLALERFGMTRADVTVREYGGGAKRLAAVRAGEIRATAINEPTTSQAREQGVNILIDLAAEKIPWLFSGVVVRRGDLTARRDLALRFMRAVIEGNYLALTDPARAKAVLTRELNIKNPKIIDISYEDFHAQSPPGMDISMRGVENVLKISAGSGSRNPADYIDGSVLEELSRSGFFDTLTDKYSMRWTVRPQKP